MICRPARLRVNLAAMCILLPTLLVTASAYGESISLNPKQGPPGTEVTVTGSGFGPNYYVPIELGESPSPLATAHVNDHRAFTTHLTIPASTSAGKLRVSANIRSSGSADPQPTSHGHPVGKAGNYRRRRDGPSRSVRLNYHEHPYTIRDTAWRYHCNVHARG